MKENKLAFCTLMATKLYQSITAVEIVWTDSETNSHDKAKELMSDKNITKMISKIEEDINLLSSPTKSWVKYKLMGVIANAEAIGDLSNVRQALDQINKLDNNYDINLNSVDGVKLTMTY